MKLQGVLVASAALALLAAGPSSAADSRNGETQDVKCAGINACGGHGECAAADGSHDCAGKNSCRGKGWLHTKTASECTERGGTVIEG